jgi:hypothetical protein
MALALAMAMAMAMADILGRATALVFINMMAKKEG